ncbi:MAG: ATP-dependent sacrificial sulfur transferase LarE [Candidatus Krumholzibacteriales bacterium]
MNRRDRLSAKHEKLKQIISGYGDRVAVAFSGGTDSSFLLAAAMDAAEQVLAVTVNADFIAQSEVDAASRVAEQIGADHEIIYVPFIDIENFAANPPDRCYFCKLNLFRKIISFAHQHGMETVMEGSNADDPGEHRPGLKAIEELGVASPLAEAGLRKREIRELSRRINLPTWDSPDNTCLATRIRTGDRITREKLQMVEEAEDFMRSLGFGLCRVRHHGSLARIEVAPEKIPDLLDPETRDSIDRKLTEIGFLYVTADMEGYNRGSMDR